MATTKIQSGAFPADVITTAAIDDASVTHAKLHTDMNLSSKTLTFAANQISGNAIDGGVISNFASTGIDDNSSATAVTILSGGNVGIGASSPNYPLEVEATGTSSTDIVGFSNSNGVAKHIFGLENVGAGTYRLLDSSNNNAVFFSGHSADNSYINAGNVGIGTSSPGVKLHVDGAGSQPELRVSQNSTYFTDYGVNHIDVNGPNDLRFLMGGSEKVRIKSGGDMSIGSDHSGFSGWRVLNMRQLSTGALINFEDDDGTRASTLAAWGSALRYQTHIAGGYHRFETDASTNAFQINDNGHVVVNKHQFGSNPTGSKLNVFGDGEVLRLDGTGNTSRTLRFRGVSTSNPGVIMADGSLEITNEDANTSIALLSERDITIKTTKSNGTAGHVKFYSYNTEIMRIDGGQNVVTTPHQPAWNAAGSGWHTTTTAGVLPLASVVMNIGNHYSGTNHRFTAPVAGVYQVNTIFYMEATGQAVLKKNGADYAPVDTIITGFTNEGTKSELTSGSVCIYLSANDYIQVGARNSQTVRCYLGHTFFSGYLVG